MQEGKTALRMWTLGAKRRDIAGQIWTPSALMAAAVYFGDVRLIDNIEL